MGNEKAEPCPICYECITGKNPNIAVFNCSIGEKLHFVCIKCYGRLDKKECPLDRNICDVIFTSINPESHLVDFEDNLYFYPTFLIGLRKTLGIDLTKQTIEGAPFLETFINKHKTATYLPFLIYKILSQNGSLSHLQSGDKYDVIMRNAPIAYAEVIVKSSDNIDLLHKVAQCRLTKSGEINDEQKQFQSAAYTKIVKLILFSGATFFNHGDRKLIWDAHEHIANIIPLPFVKGIMRLGSEKISESSLEIALQLFRQVDVNKNLLGVLMQARLTEHRGQDATAIYASMLIDSADDESYFNKECRAFAFKRLTENYASDCAEYQLYLGKYAPNNEDICDRINAITSTINGAAQVETAISYLLELSETIKQNHEAQMLILRLGIRIIENNKLYHESIIQLLQQTNLLPAFTKPKTELHFWHFLATRRSDLTTEFANFFLAENRNVVISNRQKDFLFSLNTTDMPDTIGATIAGIKFNAVDKSYRLAK